MKVKLFVAGCRTTFTWLFNWSGLSLLWEVNWREMNGADIHQALV